MATDLEKLEHGLSWVRAALDCKTWDWDGDQREVAELELADAEKIVARLKAIVDAAPLTKADLADALGCFWNAAMDAAIHRQEGTALASIMVEGVGAVAARLANSDIDLTATGVWLVRRHFTPGDTIIIAAYPDEASAKGFASRSNEADGPGYKNVEAVFVPFGEIEEGL
jgi:hypothetical protein